MLVSVTIENWMSFRDPATLSMVAGKERQHSERVPRVAKYRTRILPIVALYGGNASGKTNFFRALSFLKRFVVRGTQPDSLIPVQPYRLDSAALRQPSRFAVELLVDDTIYEFSFSATSKAVLEEKLVRVSSATERVLYHRRSGQSEEISFDDSLADREFLQFAFRGTRENQLYLTNAVSQNVKVFRPVYEWFRDSLHLITPDSRFASFEQFFERENPLSAIVNDLLAKLDTGIVRLGGENVLLDDVPVPESLKMALQSEVGEDRIVRLQAGSHGDRFIVSREGETLTATRLVSYHRRPDDTECRFDLAQESDGTLRIIDLLPALVDLSEPGSTDVYLIDEMDRSLHTLITKSMIQMYLNGCSKRSRSQILFTTHDLLLMDQRLFRRDEMWVAERDSEGVSSLMSFAEYGDDVRYDKDVRKSYLQGRLGGIPHIPLYPDLLGVGTSNRQGARDNGS